ncbi:MAG: ferrous iron transport protein A [Opitutales bacterium]
MEAASPRLTLAELKPGDRARIDCIRDDCSLCQRLFTLGVMPEGELCVVNETLFGDPITVSVADQQIALRRLDARAVEVTRIA